MKEFLEGRVDKVELIYHHFKSMGSQVLTRDNYLPIDLGKVAEEATGTVGKSSFNNDYIKAGSFTYQHGFTGFPGYAAETASGR